MPTQNTYPLSDVDTLVDKTTGIRVERGNDPDAEIRWDESMKEWELTQGSVKNLTLSQKTKDVSGDLQIRDDSSGDLFSLDDGNSPQLQAAYEGNEAFTFGRRTGSVGRASVVLGAGFKFGVKGNEASGFASMSIGNRNEASGFSSVALNSENKATNGNSFAANTQNVAAATNSSAFGYNNKATGYASSVTGANNIAEADQSFVSGKENVGIKLGQARFGIWSEVSGTDVADREAKLQDSDEMFVVGVGDNPNATSGDTDYFDGRGRVDGLYVTMRDGTHIRHGLSVDGYNASTGSYETVFEINEAGDIVEGNVDVSNVDVTAAGTDTQVQYNDGGGFGASSDFTWDGSILSVLTLNLANNNTSDTSGDIQIRDDSSGDLFSLDYEDGSPFTGDPSLLAKHEGQGAFTFGRRTGSVGKNSFVLGSGGTDENGAYGNEASGDGAVAMNGGVKFSGGGNVASGADSLVIGERNTSSGFVSFSGGIASTASADISAAIGNNVISRNYCGFVVGSYNEDYLGAGGETTSLPDLSNDDRVFSVGVGDRGVSYDIDGRGRVDGLYVTIRDGTHIRHGLSVDAYNASLEQYETVFEINEAGDIVEGNIDVSNVDVTAAGTDTQVQFNDAGSFGASPDFTWDGTNLTVNGKYQLTDSTGTYDAVAFDTSVPNYYSGSVADIATRSGAEFYVGTSDPSTIPSSNIGSQNFVVGSQNLQNSSIDGTLKFSGVSGNFVMGSSDIGSGGSVRLSVSGWAAGFDATLKNQTPTQSGNDVFVFAYGSNALRRADLTQAGNVCALGFGAMTDATGDFSSTTVIGNTAAENASDVKRSVIIGESAVGGSSNINDSVFVGSNAGSNEINDYDQPSVTGSILLGPGGGIASKSNQFVVGAAPEVEAEARGIEEVVFGRGPFSNNPASVTITTTDVRSEPASVGVNGDKSGGDMVISSGKGTGSGTPSTIEFQTPDTTSNQYDQQSLVSRVTIDDSGLSINSGNLEIKENGEGVIVSSSDGTLWEMTILNDGTLDINEL